MSPLSNESYLLSMKNLLNRYCKHQGDVTQVCLPTIITCKATNRTGVITFSPFVGKLVYMQKQVISWRGSYFPVRRLVNYNGQSGQTSLVTLNQPTFYKHGLKVLTHQKPSRRFCMLFFEVLPFTMLASSVNGKTSKKSVQKRRGGVWCV